MALFAVDRARNVLRNIKRALYGFVSASLSLALLFRTREYFAERHHQRDIRFSVRERATLFRSFTRNGPVRL